MEFCKLTDDEYSEFVLEHPQNNLNQSIYMVKSQRARGLNVELIGIKKSGRVVAAGSLLYSQSHFGYKICECVKGPLLDYRDTELVNFFTSNIKLHLKKMGVGELVISPYMVYRQRNLDGEIIVDGEDNSDVIPILAGVGYKHEGDKVNLNNVNWMVVKNVSAYQSDEELLNSFPNRTRRAAVKNAERCGVYIEQVDENNLDTFYEIIKNAAENKHFHGRNRDFYANLLKTIDSDHVKILIACLNVADYKERLLALIKQESDKCTEIIKRLEGKPNKNNETKLAVAEGLIKKYTKSLDELNTYPAKNNILPLAGVYFFCYGSEVVAAIGGAIDEYRQFDGATALYWHMMKYARNNGYKKYNFYGTFGIFDKNSTGHNIYLFKKGWGGEVVNTLGEFKLPVRPIETFFYELFKTVYQHLSTVMSGSKQRVSNNLLSSKKQ